MAVKIESIENSPIIRIMYSGNVTLDERINALHQICIENQSITNGLQILIDARLVTHVMTETEQDIFGRYIAARTELDAALVAVIVNPTPNQAINQTLLNKASMLGHNIKLFNTESEALIWLDSPDIDNIETL